jgi:hypothetical protein
MYEEEGTKRIRKRGGRGEGGGGGGMACYSPYNSNFNYLMYKVHNSSRTKQVFDNLSTFSIYPKCVISCLEGEIGMIDCVQIRWGKNPRI